MTLEAAEDEEIAVDGEVCHGMMEGMGGRAWPVNDHPEVRLEMEGGAEEEERGEESIAGGEGISFVAADGAGSTRIFLDSFRMAVAATDKGPRGGRTLDGGLIEDSFEWRANRLASSRACRR